MNNVIKLFPFHGFGLTIHVAAVQKYNFPYMETPSLIFLPQIPQNIQNHQFRSVYDVIDCPLTIKMFRNPFRNHFVVHLEHYIKINNNQIIIHYQFTLVFIVPNYYI